MKRFALLALLLGALAFAASAGASVAGHQDDGGQSAHHEDGDDDGAGGGGNGGGRTFGPYTIVTTDNGSCGQPWAADTLRRTYSVRANRDGTYTLVQRDRGTFTTTGPVSPGACNDANSRPPRQPGESDHGTVVLPAIPGWIVGGIAGTVSCTGTCMFNPTAAAACETPTSACYRDVFVTAAFGPTARFSCDYAQDPCRFRWDYFSNDPRLKYRHWVDEGTATTEHFSGDIATA